MADRHRSGTGKVPPPKKHYPDPAEEKRSKQTQAAADRYLTGKPEKPTEAGK